MKRIATQLLAACTAFSFAAPVLADPHKHQGGHGRHKHSQYKEEYWDGHCKVERKHDKRGNYKEERKCNGQGHDPYRGPAYGAAPVAVPVPAPGVYVQPPSIVRQPPTVVIR